MYRFYVDQSNVTDKEIKITGMDVNHIKNVLRLSVGEKVIICNGQGEDFYCIINSVSKDEIDFQIESREKTGSELDVKIYLFQGMPKKDKMELIIQKAVELGVHEIIPVMTKRTIVKLEDKNKEKKKLERWQTIAMAAAKQSGRGIIPRIREVITFQEAVKMANQFTGSIIPYERAEHLSKSYEVMKEMATKDSVGIFIGPEGGFEESEVNLAMENHIEPVTLGKRILRTETAGMTAISILMFENEVGKR